MRGEIMRGTSHVSVPLLVVVAALVAGERSTSGQLPIPVQGQRGAEAPPPPGQPVQRGTGQGRGQRGQETQQPDPPPVVSPIATSSAEITGPGRFFETLMALK